MIKDMDGFSESPLAALLQQRKARALIYVAMTAIALVSIYLIILTIYGYGTLHLDGIPANATVSLNGRVTTATTLKLRPGDYQLTISSPVLTPLMNIVNVPLWGQASYKPNLHARSADAIARSLLGAIPNTSIAPQFDRSQWFQSNSWLAGTLSPTETVLVAHYDAGQKMWTLVLCNAPGYPENTDSLPPEVASYVQPLLAGRE